MCSHIEVYEVAGTSKFCEMFVIFWLFKSKRCKWTHKKRKPNLAQLVGEGKYRKP